MFAAGASGNHTQVFSPSAFRYRSRDGIGDAVTAKAYACLKRSPRFNRLVRRENSVLERGAGWCYGARRDLR